ncbi:MAG TPA: M28 family peptidase [Rectinemataceae bacterium]|nr:M28 family peptidase [Rectinemataceae bacterium]
MEESGIETRRLWYDAYLSLPKSASIEMDGQVLHAIAAVYSGEARDLRGELCYCPEFDLSRSSEREKAEWRAAVNGKMILTYNGEASFAKQAHDAHALAVILAQSSKEEVIHHASIGTVWGTPGLADVAEFPYIPYVAVNNAIGDVLLSAATKGKKQASLTIEMDNSIKRSSMPVATIRGKSEKFVLVSAHYDSWYEGITDNAVSDAILIEFARVFQEFRDKLDRSIVFCWWSGHSDGRFAGSTWYCDHHWEELSKNCVAHVNIDLAGCKNADQVRARTTLMEGAAFTGDLIARYTGFPAKPFIPMIRGADQSFWGVGIPITIMLKYEPLPENCDFLCPSGGVWWHTDQDSLDKMDLGITLRDALMNAEMISRILNCRHLPVDIPGFVAMMRTVLRKLEGDIGDNLVFAPVFDKLTCLEKGLASLFSSPRFEREETDPILKSIAGELVRLMYSYGGPYGHDRAVFVKPFPWLCKAVEQIKNGRDGDVILFARTDLVRQRNRLSGQLEKLIMAIDCQLLCWKTGARPLAAANERE